MKILDTNILLYAHDETSSNFALANSFLKDTLSGSELIGLPWQVIWAFLRLATSTRVFANPIQMRQAVEIVQQLLELKQVRPLAPGDRHWKILCQVLDQGAVRGALTTDAELAALTIEHGGTLYTTDRDFARFTGLRWINPLAQV